MIQFMRYKWLYLLISSLVLVPGMISLVLFGLKPSIDFTGGTLLELKFSNSKIPFDKSQGKQNPNKLQISNTKISSSELIKDIEKLRLEVSSVQSSGKDMYLFKMKTIDRNKSAEIQNSLSKKYGKVEEIRFETVGPILGQELLNKTYIAAILACLAILSYVAWAFKNIKFGVSAVIALVHDILVVLGIFSLLGHFFGVEVDSLFVTAILTTMSFSVHDTIVVFDRIRESKKKFPKVDIETLTDKAITETMGRSLNNSLTIIFMLLALVLLGGTTTRWFMVALLIGTITGTYSSPFVATPIMVIWQKLQERRLGKR